MNTNETIPGTEADHANVVQPNSVIVKAKEGESQGFHGPTPVRTTDGWWGVMHRGTLVRHALRTRQDARDAAREAARALTT